MDSFIESSSMSSGILISRYRPVKIRSSIPRIYKFIYDNKLFEKTPESLVKYCYGKCVKKLFDYQIYVGASYSYPGDGSRAYDIFCEKYPKYKNMMMENFNLLSQSKKDEYIPMIEKLSNFYDISMKYIELIEDLKRKFPFPENFRTCVSENSIFDTEGIVELQFTNDDIRDILNF